MVTQKKRSQSTRALLQDAFRNIALDQGLESATTEAVLARTGLSKGALYHHFRSKTDLVEAIYRTESHRAIGKAVESSSAESTMVGRIKATCAAWLKEIRRPTVSRILFDIGPQALGVKRVIEIENSLSLKVFEDFLIAANERGEISVSNPALAARLLNAYVGEVALQKRSDREEAEATIGPVVDAILDSLKPGPRPA